jgi:catechol 2,3-dioxygenase-like lactoylglutathione lyase family enzyme
MTDSHLNALQFLELSLPVGDVRKSLEWYRSLGLIELATNDIRPYHYAVISDGDFCIGLHDNDLPGPGLSFIRQNLARHVLDRMDAGEEFIYAPLGEDIFHESAQTDPDGSLAIMVEARTFSPSHAEEKLPLIGRLEQIILPCLRTEELLDFWQRYGFIAVESETHDHAELHAPGLLVGLHAGTRMMTLRFQPQNYAAAVAALNQTHTLKMFYDRDVKGVELISPEGTCIQLLNS